MEPDEFYCLELLEKYGFCVAPGSAFGQKADTYHFRATIIANLNEIKTFVSTFKAFHEYFLHFWN
jgi:alanine transaminase